MSKSNPSHKKTSSLHSLSTPSNPPSPSFQSIAATSAIETTQSPTPSDDTIRHLQHISASHTTEIHSMQTTFTSVLKLVESMSSKIDNVSANFSAPVSAFASNHANNTAHAIDTNNNTIISNTPQTNTVQNRIQNADKISSAAKTLYDLPIAEQQSILQYAQSASAVNSSFNELDDTVANDEIKVSSHNNNNNNYNFISRLMPVSADALHPPSMDEIFKAGFKAAASNPKVKDANAFIELLIEQAKVITSNNSNTNNNNNPATVDYLHYSLQLIKLLFEFGLHAVVEFHFKVMKKIQQTQCSLTADHPILLFELVTKYKRLNHTNLLHSTPVYFNSNPNSSYKSKSSFGRTSTKFTGTPCPFHTAKLGRPANHSESDCRVAKQQSKQ